MNKNRPKELYLGYLLEGIWDELDSSLKKALTLQFCNEACLELCAKKYPFIQILQVEK